MKSKARYFQVLSLAILAQPIIAAAHPMNLTSESIGFFSGMSHPLMGSDHIITMLTVGFWLSQTNRQTTKILPFVFMALMLMGCGLSIFPIQIAHAENVMNLSALVLGLILAFGYKVSSFTATLIVGNLALFHGYVHAYDIWLDVDRLSYTIGFSLTTLALIAIGIAIRIMVKLFVDNKPDYFAGKGN
ncbi:HupE/UreJ family protein [Methylomonas sp. UP202]|uniref:HupE/UreJ family protein n=1 Tax=Methylomonas sp. UP202 TaxID=3040943 RepID=UPI00247AEF5D|nr:HupE/UreJ family protein [Methylomonas sp. UP202]WGS85098.1 HupE/UreJ family protein [Methylomonas sp. UP202]